MRSEAKRHLGYIEHMLPLESDDQIEGCIRSMIIRAGFDLDLNQNKTGARYWLAQIHEKGTVRQYSAINDIREHALYMAAIGFLCADDIAKFLQAAFAGGMIPRA